MLQDQLDPVQREIVAADRKKQSKARAEEERNDLVQLMSQRWGRRIMYGILGEAGIYTSSFTGDQAGTFFNEGKRALGLKYLSFLNANCPEQFVLMLKEHGEDGR